MNQPTSANLGESEAEGAILGIMQLWPDTIHQMHQLTVDDFMTQKNAVLWELLNEMSSKGIDIGDRVLVMSELRSIGKLDSFGGPVWLSDLCSIPSNSGNISNYIAELKKKTSERIAVAACKRFNSELGTCDSLELIERLKNDLNGSTSVSEKLKGKTLKQIGYEALDPSQRENSSTFKTGYFQLDDAIGGQFGNTSFTVIAAGPSYGKTALALNLMQNSRKEGKPIKCLYVGMEMSEPEIFDRFVTANSGIPGQIVNELRMDRADDITRGKYMERYAKSCVDVGEAGHIIKSDGLVSINEFRALVAMYAKDIDCAILDYIQQLRPTNSKHSEMEKINEASWSCKELASTYNIPVFALSQLNRDGYKDGCKPSLANLRASGQLEQDANNVFLMWREKKEEATDEPVEIFLAKNRNGPVCRVKLHFDLIHGRIENLKPEKYR